MVSYDVKKKEVEYNGRVFEHFSGGESTDLWISTLVRFKVGEISLQEAWLEIKYIEEIGG